MIARTASALMLLLGASVSVSLTLGCSAPPPEAVGIDHSPDTGYSGYCRTTTCQPPNTYPLDGQCEPLGWSESETCRNVKKASNAPVWWRSSCVGYDLNASASRKVSYEAFREAAAAAFAQWTGASCPTNGSGSSRVSIDIRDMGPVPCNHRDYHKDAPNQNVITFHDDAWPYEEDDKKVYGTAKSPVIALTTVTFEPETGEIFDADMEINSKDYNVVPVDGPVTTPDTYDLQTVMTHEAGHFFGLAHSPSEAAVMFSSGDTTGGTRKRSLTANDVRGICAIYPPNATRNVSILADPSGVVAAGACDPTPRHGFTASCN